jgi:beta-ureidopropionase / N-carbamoyl-L-amino-acid hydrolase
MVLRINGERLRADFDELAQIGATVAGGITRVAFSDEDIEACVWLGNRIEEAGLLADDDDVGNMYGTLPCADANAKTLLLGSHLDSIPNGGRFDGSVGVLAALECLRTLKEHHIALPFHVSVVNFRDEEGSWQSLFGSRGMAGQLRPLSLLDTSTDMTAFHASLARTGLHPEMILYAARDPQTLIGYFELHIEQGPYLERAQTQIGVVTHIIGRTTLDITFQGQAGHSGTTTREARRDALQGAAYFITKAHEYVRENFEHGVFNCGNIVVKPGAYNIIPEKAILTVECRHINEQVLQEMEKTLMLIAQGCANEYMLSVGHRRIQHMPAAPMHAPAQAIIAAACERLQLTQMPMVSYAGHDAQVVSSITSSGLIFIPSMGGVSRNPAEYSKWEDVTNGANVLLHSVLLLAEHVRAGEA